MRTGYCCLQPLPWPLTSLIPKKHPLQLELEEGVKPGRLFKQNIFSRQSLHFWRANIEDKLQLTFYLFTLLSRTKVEDNLHPNLLPEDYLDEVIGQYFNADDSRDLAQ